MYAFARHEGTLACTRHLQHNRDGRFLVRDRFAACVPRVCVLYRNFYGKWAGMLHGEVQCKTIEFASRAAIHDNRSQLCKEPAGMLITDDAVPRCGFPRC